MSTTKHTPRPWLAAAKPSSVVGWPVVGPMGRMICSMAWLPHMGADAYEATKANADLIAAAPDLLAAAQRVLAHLNARIDAAPSEEKPLFDGLADLHLAIRKATGAE